MKLKKKNILHSQEKFYMVTTSGQLDHELFKKLNNGRDLSIYFHGIGNTNVREGKEKII